MHSNHHTFQQYHTTISNNSQRPQQHSNKNTRPRCTLSSNHLSTLSNQPDPFAKMNAYVNYQQKIESLKSSLVSNKSGVSAPKVTTRTIKDDGEPVRMTKPLNSTSQRHSIRRESFTIDMMMDDDGRYWSNGSVISSGSSNSGSGNSTGYLTPPRSSSPLTTTTTTTTTCDEQQLPYDSNTCYVTMEEKVKFLAFLRYRTGWQTKTTTDTVTDLDYMKNSGSLFFWNG